MAIGFGAKVMDDAVQFVRADYSLLLARDLKIRLNLDDIIYLGEVHQTWTENESLEMDH